MIKTHSHWIPRGPVRLLPLVLLLLLMLTAAPSAWAAGSPEEEAAPPPAAEEAPAQEEIPPPPPPVIEIPVLQTEVVLPPVPPPPVEVPVLEGILEPVTAPVVGEAPEAPVGAPKEEKTSEPPAEGASGQGSSEGSQSGTGRQPPQLTPSVGQTPSLAPVPAEQAAPLVSTSAPAVAAAVKARKAAAKRARQATCALSSVGAAMTEDCIRGESGGWLVAQSTPGSFPPPSSLTPIGVRAAGRHAKDPAGVENNLSVPPRGPAPAGGDEGPAAGGAASASGAAVAAVALLHLSVPHLTRRLRTHRRSWRTSFFVLIPERPG